MLVPNTNKAAKECREVKPHTIYKSLTTRPFIVLTGLCVRKEIAAYISLSVLAKNEVVL